MKSLQNLGRLRWVLISIPMANTDDTLWAVGFSHPEVIACALSQ